MAFTTPRTWVASEVVTAAIGNTHWRDNLAWLGTDKPHCRVHHSAAQSVANNTRVALALNTDRFDVGAMHDIATNNSRITVPSGGAGKYLIGGHVEWQSGAIGVREIDIKENATTFWAIERIRAEASNEGYRQTIMTMVLLSATDFVELEAFHTQGAALNVTATEAFTPEFFAIWLST